MTFRIIAFSFILVCFNAWALISPEQCMTLRNDVGKAMLLTMLEDFGISRDSIIKEKTETELISQQPVTYSLALTYGETEKKLSGENSDDPTTAEEYAAGFMAKNARQLLVKYTFENVARRHNVLLASALVNDDDCAVRFNGYLVVKREF